LALPEPYPGLVIGYAYLWRDEARRGRTEGAEEIPAPTKARLGLDSERSWIVVNEVNRFVWPGVDLRPASRDTSERFDYGTLPPRVFAAVLAKLVNCARHKRTAIVRRDP
jgi:hypothetical protein